MYCSHCGATVPENARFCHECGQILHPQLGHPPHPHRRFSFLRFHHPWIKSLIFIILVVAGYYTYHWYTQPNPLSPVTEQLKALSENKMTQAYYAYTSRFFQAEYSLEKFKEFVESHPILTKHTTRDFEDAVVNDNVATVNGTITSQEGESYPLEFKLYKEKNSWKIISIRFVNYQTHKDEEISHEDVEKLMSPINQFFSRVEAKNYEEAYQDTAPAFRKDTPYEMFVSFCNRYRFLFEESTIQYQGQRKEGDLVVVLITITTEEGAIPTEFKLSKENDQWKIWSMRVTFPSKELMTALDADQQIKVVQEQLKAIKGNEIQAAYENYASKTFKNETSIEQFEQFIGKFPIFGSYESFELGTPKQENGVARIRVTLKGKEGDYELEYILESGGFEWKVRTIQVISEPEKSTQARLDQVVLTLREEFIQGAELVRICEMRISL